MTVLATGGEWDWYQTSAIGYIKQAHTTVRTFHSKQLITGK